MPNQQSEKMLRELNRKALEYADKSTRLSDLLDDAEAFLNSMPGKLEVSVGESWNQLSFTRHDSGWRLWHGDDLNGALVTSAAVDVKACAAQLLPELVEKLLASITERLDQVNAGLDALKNVPFLADEQEAK